MEPTENIVTFESMLIGYVDAVARFDVARRTHDQIATYNSLFESLNWAVALDERIGEHWVPDGEPLRGSWRERLGHGAEIMGGVKCARNSVHHDWSDALALRSGAYLPAPLPAPLFEWVWRAADELPPPGQRPHEDNEMMYRQHMEGRPVRLCLDVLGGAFATLQRLLEPHTILRVALSQPAPHLGQTPPLVSDGPLR